MNGEKEELKRLLKESFTYKMRYSLIKPNDSVNGEGISVSLWTQGCPHYCDGCFNKSTWSFDKGKEFTKTDMLNILDLLDADKVHRNLSILGGEPLCPENLHGVLELCAYIKKYRPSTKVFVWTGYTWEELLVKYDTSLFNFDVLIDGKFEKGLKDLSLVLRGSSNQRIIDVKKTLKSKEIVNYL